MERNGCAPSESSYGRQASKKTNPYRNGPDNSGMKPQSNHQAGRRPTSSITPVAARNTAAAISGKANQAAGYADPVVQMGQGALRMDAAGCKQFERMSTKIAKSDPELATSFTGHARRRDDYQLQAARGDT